MVYLFCYMFMLNVIITIVNVYSKCCHTGETFLQNTKMNTNTQARITFYLGSYIPPILWYHLPITSVLWMRNREQVM